MKRLETLLRARATAALVPGTAAVAACAAVLGVEAWRSPSFPVAVVVGLAAGLTGGILVMRPLQRRLAAWDARLRDATRRLEEAEARRAHGDPDPVHVLDSFELPGAVPDESMEDALSELAAALQDEERLRDRRRARETEVRSTIRTARDLGESGIATRLPALLQEIDTGVRGIREACDGVLQQAITSAEVSRMVSENALAGKESCGRATRRAAEMETRVQDFSKLVHRLEARSREIGQVLLVLNDITEQTNLLALNAAIIAAQAGEEGKGFGVVADEMRNLSERASSSTKETEILARTLQDDVTKAVQGLGDAGDNLVRLREALADSQEAGAVLGDLSQKEIEATRAALEGAERQAADARDLSGKLREVRDERERLDAIEREVVQPMRDTLGRTVDLLDELWQLGAVREALRARLEAGIRAIRDHRGREISERETLQAHLRALRESGRAWMSALEAGRRRDDLVRDLAREIHTLAQVGNDR